MNRPLGLDITTQKAVMDLVRDLTRERGMSSILITHDLGLAAEYCDRLAVMKDGQIVETGPQPPCSPTRSTPIRQAGRCHAAPRRVPARSAAEGARTPLADHAPGERALVQVRDLVKTYPGKSGPVHAVKGISFTIREGQSVGLVGESGCGKSTTSSMLVRLLDRTSGDILFDGFDIAISRRPVRARHAAQPDPDGVPGRHRQPEPPPFRPPDHRRSDPPDERLRGAALTGGSRNWQRCAACPALLDRFPHQLSGGQKARVGIARAIALDPKFLILDEPTAALDVSIQAVVLNLLADLRARLGMTYLFVSHDLNVVRLLCDHVIVMQGGEIVEQGPAAQVMDTPSHPYTRTLLAAAPKPPAPAESVADRAAEQPAAE
jgi:peptide/nickel transport system ATP-binding protein